MIDDYLSVHDFTEVHSIVVRASRHAVDAAVAELDLSSSLLVRCLFALRGMPASALTLKGMQRIGFQPLAHRPGEELAIGLIGRFWTLRGGLRRFAPDEFATFSRPGYARAVWTFRMFEHAGGTRLETETRIHCTDDVSRRRFARYWTVIRPFSGLIRMEALKAIRKTAEAVT
ncbi:hypothetical protein BH23GEM9_BH23GEM9_28540 [soil metagenome]